MIHPRIDYNDRIQDTQGLIPDDEPVFLLRAQDSAAVAAVRAWAIQNERLGGDKHLSDVARTWANRMAQWPVKKLADLPKDPVKKEKPKAKKPKSTSANSDEK